MKTRMWYQIAIRIDETHQDLLVGQMTQLGFSGFIQEHHSLICFIPKVKWTRSIQKIFRSILSRFKHEFPAADLALSLRSLREENWNKTWEKQTGIVQATPHIFIKPSWTKLPKSHRNKLILHIDPKMSFGTGHHETTRLSLNLLERFLQPDMNVIDFGCGTGVLGIACAKMGARTVFAVDNDEWAIENTAENIRRNAVQTKIKLQLGSIRSIPRRHYDLLIANIDFLTISRFIKPLASRIRKEGIVILSTADMPRLLPLFKKNSLSPVQLDSENEWTAIALTRT
jgi:ribosomal protein L11 methyltransferase